jgi:hypothetical protein
VYARFEPLDIPMYCILFSDPQIEGWKNSLGKNMPEQAAAGKHLPAQPIHPRQVMDLKLWITHFLFSNLRVLVHSRTL